LVLLELGTTSDLSPQGNGKAIWFRARALPRNVVAAR
jgi:hypothetical protein